MKLKRIKIYMDHNLGDKIYCSHFEFRVFVMGYCLTQRLKKLKFETDGTFDTIFIKAGLSPGIELNNYSFDRSIRVSVPFDFRLYDISDDTLRCRQYFDLTKTSLIEASKIKSIPLEELLESLTSLADNNFVYIWDFKSIYVREYNFKIKFICRLTTKDFTLNISAFDKKGSLPVCEGQVIRTLPDDIFFGDISKKIGIRDGKAFISQRSHEYLSIDLEGLSRGQLKVDFTPAPNPDNETATAIFYSLQKDLRYDNDDFICDCD